MTIEEIRKNAPDGTDYICAIWGCDIEYFKDDNASNFLMEWKKDYWGFSRLTKDDLNLDKFDVLICN